MYGFAEMIEMGLQEGEEFASEDHRTVAVNLGICNPRVTTRDTLVGLVTAVNKIPADRIRTVTPDELKSEFDDGDVNWEIILGY